MEVNVGDERNVRDALANLFNATAASLSGTATRTISQPARTISSICATVAPTSAVSVFVIDWIDTGAPPPI